MEHIEITIVSWLYPWKIGLYLRQRRVDRPLWWIAQRRTRNDRRYQRRVRGWQLPTGTVRCSQHKPPPGKGRRPLLYNYFINAQLHFLTVLWYYVNTLIYSCLPKSLEITELIAYHCGLMKWKLGKLKCYVCTLFITMH